MARESSFFGLGLRELRSKVHARISSIANIKSDRMLKSVQYVLLKNIYVFDLSILISP